MCIRDRLNALVPEIDEEVQVVSEATGKGQHTTTTSTLYQLDDGAALIDSPGIRAFALWGLEPTQLKDYFPEIKALLGQCHFHNCLHIEEPRCAVRQAVESEALPPERYEAYLNLFYDLKEELGR